MSTSSSERPEARSRVIRRTGRSGFSLIEILLGLSLAMSVALGVAPVWSTFQSVGVQEGDRTIWALQARVAAARLERDLRLGGTTGCPFATSATVLEATSSHVVLLVPAQGSVTPLLVEWELANGCLMRRWGVCPAALPAVFSHSLYSDNKTMLEGVDTANSRFAYLTTGSAPALPIAAGELALIDRVGLTLHPGDRGGQTGVGDGAITASGWVGR